MNKSLVYLLALALTIAPAVAAEEREPVTEEAETSEQDSQQSKLTYGPYMAVGIGTQANREHFKALPFDTTSAASTFQVGLRLDFQLVGPLQLNFWPGFASTNYGTAFFIEPNIWSIAVRIPVGVTLRVPGIGFRLGGYYRHVFNSKLAAENVAVTGPVDLKGIDAEINFDFGFYAGFVREVDERVELEILAMAEQDVFDFVFAGGVIVASYKINQKH